MQKYILVTVHGSKQLLFWQNMNGMAETLRVFGIRRVLYHDFGIFVRKTGL